MKQSRSEPVLVSILISEDAEPFELVVEPEAMSYRFPEERRVLLTFRGTAEAKFEISRWSGGMSIWRPADTEVWAATQRDPVPRQIGGWNNIPFPSLDTGALRLPTEVEWDHLPLPPADEGDR
jgi:hypothetical protein